MTDLSSASVEELKKVLAEKEKEEKQKHVIKKAAYEKARDNHVEFLVDKATHINVLLAEFKADCHRIMDLQAEKLNEYGTMRANSKGGFGVPHSSGEFKVIRTRSTEPSWDERSLKAVALINDFLKDTVKKKDVKTFDILMSFIQKNEHGELKYDRVMTLLSHANSYDDPRWVEGLKLIQESYTINQRAIGYEIKRKDASGKMQTINLNFSSI
jgi:Protein of unknown function (DUF3164)